MKTLKLIEAIAYAVIGACLLVTFGLCAMACMMAGLCFIGLASLVKPSVDEAVEFLKKR